MVALVHVPNLPFFQGVGTPGRVVVKIHSHMHIEIWVYAIPITTHGFLEKESSSLTNCGETPDRSIASVLFGEKRGSPQKQNTTTSLAPRVACGSKSPKLKSCTLH